MKGKYNLVFVLLFFIFLRAYLFVYIYVCFSAKDQDDTILEEEVSKVSFINVLELLQCYCYCLNLIWYCF